VWRDGVKRDDAGKNWKVGIFRYHIGGYPAVLFLISFSENQSQHHSRRDIPCSTVGCVEPRWCQYILTREQGMT